VIQAKAKGRKITLEATAEPRQAEVVDLMERLRQSLAGKRHRAAKSGSPTPHGKPRSAASLGGAPRKPKRRSAA
jgi:non-homologous end joining protein Ku